LIRFAAKTKMGSIFSHSDEKQNAGHLDLPLILRCEAPEVIEKLETKNQEKR